METIERTEPSARMSSPNHHAPGRLHPVRKWPYRLWRGTVAFLAVAAVSFAVGGLTALRDIAAAGWQNAFVDFRWAVLVTGDRVELDEIGRYLKQLDGVDEVTFLPATAMMDRLKSEPLLENHLSALDPARLPSIWQMTWSPDFDLDSVDDTVADLRRLPGIVDIVYEQRELDKIHFFRGTWLKVRLILAALTVIGALLGSVLLGRFLFFTNLAALRPARVTEVTLIALGGWFAGLFLARGLVGAFSWHLAWGGLAAGLARLALAHTRRFE
jgi:hypothetical protein